MAVVALVLMLARSNVATFLLARALDRGKDVAVRLALERVARFARPAAC